jgi:hypothetical protein
MSEIVKKASEEKIHNGKAKAQMEGLHLRIRSIYCEHGNEPLNFIKDVELLAQVSKY